MTQDPTNLLLEALPPKTLAHMLAVTETVLLPVRSRLYEPDVRPRYAYFLTSGIASVVLNTARGQVAEIGIVGREGLVGAIHLLGSHPLQTQCFMQIAGSARRLPLVELEEIFKSSVPMHTGVLEFVQAVSILTGQLAACNALHTIEQRLARWLLVVQDRMQSDGYALTHEFLAEMLVVQRPTLSIVAAALQREGVIQYRHGYLTILKRERLQEIACECYGIAQTVFDTMYVGDRPVAADTHAPNGTS